MEQPFNTGGGKGQKYVLGEGGIILRPTMGVVFLDPEGGVVLNIVSCLTIGTSIVAHCYYTTLLYYIL